VANGEVATLASLSLDLLMLDNFFVDEGMA